MAGIDPIVVASVLVLLENVLSLASHSIGFDHGVDKDLEHLRRLANAIISVLVDAEKKQMLIWLQSVEAVAYDAVVVLDELNYEILRRKVNSRKNLRNKVRLITVSSIDAINLRWRMVSKLREINMRLEKLDLEVSGVGLNRLIMSPDPHPSTAGVTVSRQTDSIIGRSVVVGRDRDVSEIVQTLLYSSSDQVVSVIPIIGMGGLGKTTLAKLVYNYPAIGAHFVRRIWVCASEIFEVTELFKLILASLRRTKVEMSSRDDIVHEIRRELDGKRYLLVLDDVWDVNVELWDSFFDSLVGISTVNGNWCLFTTRLPKVASIVSRDPAYLLGKLSDDDCWSIISMKATESRDLLEELLGVVKSRIVKYCYGLPLAANAIGSLLRIQNKENWHWQRVEALLNASGYHEDILEIMRLNFDILPSPIKKCFAYCSLFDADDEIERELLIELWMAEGFLQEHLQKEKMEEIGTRYLNTLVQMSLLEEVRERRPLHDKRRGTLYKMHDLVRDLALSISKPQYIGLENGMTSYSYSVRYLALDISGEIKMLTYTSALILERSSKYEGMLGKFKYLRTLNLSKAKLNELPNSIGKLKHLRFLNLSNSKIKSLPESLSRLYNLQTLRMAECFAILHLPREMSSMISLRHLHYFNSDEKFQMPEEIGRLTCLQTLEFFNVGEKKGRQVEELGHLNDLKGKLVIRNLELVKSKEGAKRANLIQKPNLLKLELRWGSENREALYSDEYVLEGLEPHPNLQNLVIRNFMGDRFPQWLGNLPMLVKLKFIGCKKCVELPALGHLPFLEYVELRDLGKLRCIGTAFYGLHSMGLGSTSSSSGDKKVVASSRIESFPALRTLTISNMRSLTEWAKAEVFGSGGVFPVLENLTIEDCSQLTTAPTHFPSLKRFTNYGKVQVLVVKSILSQVKNTIESLALDDVDELTSLSHAIGPQYNSWQSNLKYLELSRCFQVEQLWDCHASLEILRLVGCKNLIELPEDLFQIQSLRWLEIRACPRIRVLLVDPHPIPIEAGQKSQNLSLKNNLTSLTEFIISDCVGLTSIVWEPLEFGTSLRRLMVYDCSNLVSFPLDLQQTPFLSTVWLHRCPELFVNSDAMPRGFHHLTCLRELRIGPRSDHDSAHLFDWFGLESSSTLRVLTVCGLSDMESLLPDNIQLLTSLTELFLWDYGLIEALPDWIGNLTSLEKLGLWDCPKLQHLPSMPAMKGLSKLRILDVYNCPLLKKRCSPDGGPDSEWSKISHIPNRWIV